ncbi:hypothetical protein C495_05102 [Natronorubrum sulfidifaciens JCM 14089]|uniref:Uncharacterized protein n=1 Tax=Natronorubrum sulfidifaciens JCM 14089 TaxID=1230460 RepID=L9WGZ9_9EURY|nr:hypothetical protein C495_05102 [Natronorubrum sulfidifaciens JCM 14089]
MTASELERQHPNSSDSARVCDNVRTEKTAIGSEVIQRSVRRGRYRSVTRLVELVSGRTSFCGVFDHPTAFSIAFRRFCSSQ